MRTPSLICVAFFALTSPSAGADFCDHKIEYMSINQDDTIAKIKKICKPGQTIAITGKALSVIGMVCDFTKTIFKSNENMAICVIAEHSDSK
jgi:hypothetical protein